MASTATTLAAATDSHRQRRTWRSVLTLKRMMAYRPRYFHSTSA